jgi:Protein of unknown function (DUF3313)
MNSGRSARKLVWAACAAAGLLSGHSQAVLADPPPQVSSDGLQLKKSTKTTVIYVKPGVNWGQYSKVALLDCLVEFDKNWQSNYNSDQISTTNRVTDADMDRIKKDVATEFRKVFTKELQANGGYPVVDTGGPEVLVLRPAIINLRVTAPDLMSPGIGGTVVDSAGSATLYIELWDSSTNTLLARAMDAEVDPGFAGGGMGANRVTNAMAADNILKDWATRLRKYLQAARAAPPG